MAGWLLRRPSTRLLGQAHAMLAVCFATLAIPPALSARATASVFALEGVGLVWLCLRQQRRIPQIGGVALQLLAAVGVAFGVDVWRYHAVAMANATCMSTLLIALAGCASAWFVRDAGHPRRAGGVFVGAGLVDAVLQALRRERGAQWQPAQAYVAAQAQPLAGEAALQPAATPRDCKRWLLRGILVGGALLVGGFALGLLRSSSANRNG
ncbi:hypothetical protein BVV10_17340 [Xanthomonas oryzae pv. oryzae]|nr:hypothetical protein BVV16_17310 [Xanthomonas oryzae pv. oryzae]AUI96241.1 hypothetical protein BVV17_17335 [Xanthomonas oryzae pv. oryzae]AUI99913.1 hypothetical protein BVV18_17330 [Xanthomonas oryzae pv. oryzae]AUJ03590.1 hypothetical protein BVV10_17340 [Xanthomonas oryzae pv. oryzae]AUJ07257.1 hypothetical protein BVV19_17365 [Xanthomonas oryzae pv. oryzae]